uniref:Anthranilate synthase component 2 n=1 Tax=Corallina officinalis TaxID=35170 RepID=A0A6M3WB64_COROI|nr:anthranilate synthase component II [Corallina officinalis]QJF58510.1 anthranilate synthase component II [Corallina officinalis]QJF58709.1 anthranilate synthase component II [Corallina officinalis]QJF58908.1 anthranilate synthase component II [Corallina officinalis]
MILIIDNYDSFTHNLVQYVGELGYRIKIARNDKLSIEEIFQFQPSHIIISPGPGNPKASGISLDVIKHFSYKIPILGVCLGHQGIGYIYGGKIKKLNQPMHGKISKIYHNGEDIFYKLPNPFLATRYHSLVIDNNNLPNELKVTAKTEDGIIMACQHRQYTMVRGIQFHPESLWTEYGKTIIKNFLLSNHH